jgi:hypothetical protein
MDGNCVVCRVEVVVGVEETHGGLLIPLSVVCVIGTVVIVCAQLPIEVGEDILRCQIQTLYCEVVNIWTVVEIISIHGQSVLVVVFED